MRKISKIVIHCADTPDKSPTRFTAADIDRWHKDRGFRRSDAARKKFNPTLGSIGYHYVILRDGTLQTGRAESEVGAHAVGHNSVSIGICLIGQRRFTPEQWAALRPLLQGLAKKYPGAQVVGHSQLDSHGKTCPNFDVPQYVADGYIPADASVQSA